MMLTLLRKEVITMSDKNQYKLILSVNDQQHEVAAWDDIRSGEMTLELLQCSYNLLQLWISNSAESQERPAIDQTMCGTHHVPLVERKSRFNSGIYWACPHKNEDGTYCKYRPAKS